MSFQKRVLVGRIATVSLIALILQRSEAHSQVVAPVGADDVSVGQGTGLVSPLTPTGGYSTEVPIELPSSRGSFALPLSVRYTGSANAGAAGAGWEIPLSTIYVSKTTWHRKPASSSATPTAENILGIMDEGGFIPNGNGEVFLSAERDATFIHGVDRARGVAFSTTVRVDPGTATIERTARHGNPRTIIVRSGSIVSANVVEVHVRTKNALGGFDVATIAGEAAIREFLKNL